MADWIDPRMFPAQLEPLPVGETFLLPVCIDTPTLNRLLTAAYYGADHLEAVSHDPQQGTRINTYEHMGALFEAMAYVGSGTSPCGVETPPGDGCNQIGAFHPAVGYYYNHPILTPTAIAPGWDAPMWQTGAAFGPTYLPTDALLNAAALLNFVDFEAMVEAGIPNFSITVNGTGEVDIQFLKVPQGGLALVVVDGGANVDVIDLSLFDYWETLSVETILTLLGLAVGEPLEVLTHEIPLTTTGDHTITVYFFPNLDVSEFPPIGYGGGLRSMQLCGVNLVDTEEVLPYNLTIDGCTLELRLDAAIVDTIDLTACIQAIANPQLRDDGCQLQVFDLETEIYEDVPGASYFRTQADCPITDTTEIEKSLTGQFTALQLKNTNAAPGSNSGVTIAFQGSGPDLINHDYQQGAIYSRWHDLATLKGRLTFTVFHDDDPIDIVRVGAGSQAVQILQYASKGHSQALRLVRQEGGYNSTRALDVITGSRNLGGISWEGQLSGLRRNTVNNAVTPALTLDAWADGVTPAGGFGPSIAFTGQSSISEAQPMAEIEAKWGNPTHAAREAELALRVRSYGTSERPIRLAVVDQASALAFHNAAPIPKPVVTGETEYAALSSLLDALDAYNLIQDNTAIVPDAGSGGGAVPIVKEMVTEVYYDCGQATLGFSAAASGYGLHAPTIGWGPGSNGFRVGLNHDEGQDWYWARVQFETNFTEDTLVTFGVNIAGSRPRIIRQVLIGPDEGTYPNGLFVWEGPIWRTTSVVSSIQLGCWDTYDPSLHGSINMISLDIAFIGRPNLQQNTWDAVYPFGIDMVAKYIDLTDPVPVYAWDKAPGGDQPPEFVFIAQE